MEMGCVLYFCFEFFGIIAQNLTLNDIEPQFNCNKNYSRLPLASEVVSMYETNTVFQHLGQNHPGLYYPHTYIISNENNFPHGFGIISVFDTEENSTYFGVERFPENRSEEITHYMCVLKKMRPQYFSLGFSGGFSSATFAMVLILTAIILFYVILICLAAFFRNRQQSGEIDEPERIKAETA